jgi:hypothetical protein
VICNYKVDIVSRHGQRCRRYVSEPEEKIREKRWRRHFEKLEMFRKTVSIRKEYTTD